MYLSVPHALSHMHSPTTLLLKLALVKSQMVPFIFSPETIIYNFQKFSLNIDSSETTRDFHFASVHLT